jgi:prepilin-type N-terminal cleavage/methylation domain-containing protein
MIQRRRAQRGVTLIELMVVVVIIAVFAALMFGVNSQTYGASATNVADQLTTDLNVCKMRAVSTRRWHRCELTPTTLTMWQWSKTGMTIPASTDLTYVWQQVSVDNVPVGVTVWDGNTTVCITGPCGAAPGAANSTLDFFFDFRPDGSSTGGTIYVSDPGKNKQYRVVVYKSTGSSYARNSW